MIMRIKQKRKEQNLLKRFEVVKENLTQQLTKIKINNYCLNWKSILSAMISKYAESKPDSINAEELLYAANL